MQKKNLISEQYQNEIITAVKNENDMVFITYSVLERTEEKIKFALAKILEKHNRFDLFTPVYSCLKELISNATKANAKKMLMLEGEIKDVNNSADIVKKVRSILNEKSVLEYGIKSRKHGLSTRIYLKVYKKHLAVEVINNIPLTKKEMDKINDRIKKSSKYDNIAEFFMENPDPEAEGMGLGLSMVVVLLKNINITHKNFAVTTNGIDKTFAKVLIPLS